MKTIQARLTDIEYKKLRYILEIEGNSTAEFIRNCVQAKLDHTIKDNPKIWSHMEEEEQLHKKLYNQYIK